MTGEERSYHLRFEQRVCVSGSLAVSSDVMSKKPVVGGYLSVRCRIMASKVPFVVRSDHEDTLLDHDAFDWALAAPALDRRRAIRASVVLAGLPPMVENGAGAVGIEATGIAVRQDY